MWCFSPKSQEDCSSLSSVTMVFSRYVDGTPQVKIINWNDENISFTVVQFMFYLYSAKSQNSRLKVLLYRKVKTQQSDDPLSEHLATVGRKTKGKLWK